MKIEGRRIKKSRLIRAGRFIVQVKVDAVIPDADHSEPCCEPEVVEFIRQIHDRAEAGDIEWLRTVGDVYILAHSKSAQLRDVLLFATAWGCEASEGNHAASRPVLPGH